MDTHEHVGRVLENPSLGKCQEVAAKPAVPGFRGDADGLDVTRKGTSEIEDEKAVNGRPRRGYVHLLGRIPEHRERRLEGATERPPGLRGDHELSARKLFIGIGTPANRGGWVHPLTPRTELANGADRKSTR